MLPNFLRRQQKRARNPLCRRQGRQLFLEKLHDREMLAADLVPIIQDGVPADLLHGQVDSLRIAQTAINGEFDHVVTGDFNSDGRDDLLFHAMRSGNNRWFFSRSDGSFNYYDTLIAPSAINGEFDHVATGDFNGDGRDDVVFHAVQSGNNRFFYSRGTAQFDYVGTRIAPSAVNGEFDHLVVGDYDGNGIDDLLFHAIHSGNNRWFLGRPNGTLDFAHNPIDPKGVNTEFDHVVSGDFNGDGRDDLLFHATASGNNRWSYRRADGSLDSLLVNPINPSAINTVFDHVVSADVNRDGRTDVVFHDTESGYNRWFYSQGNSKFLGLFDNPIDTPAVNSVFNHLVAGDFNGDGAGDFLFHAHPSGYNRFAVSRIAAVPQLAGLTVSWDPAQSQIHIIGSKGDDSIRLTVDSGALVLNGTLRLGAESRISRIIAHGLAGNDFIYLAGIKIPAVIHGGAGKDTLIGGEAADELVGNGENDRIFGNGGSDYLSGGAGNDILDGGTAADTVDYSDSPQGVTVDLATLLSTGHGTDTIWNLENVIGSMYSDYLYGNDGKNHLDGRDGDDFLYGRGEYDVLVGGRGNDELDGGAGANMVDYRALPAATLSNVFFPASLYGVEINVEGSVGVVVNLQRGTAAGDGFDKLRNIYRVEGSPFNDVLIGSNNSDELLGNNGDDILLGLDGSLDWLYGDDGRDSALGHGNDRLYGGNGPDMLDGGGGDDGLYGGRGDDALIGQTGNDGLFGGAGIDSLYGGPGYDRLLSQEDDIVTSYAFDPNDVNLNFLDGDASNEFTAGRWTDQEIERIDQALQLLHSATGNKFLLQAANGRNFSFHRHGMNPANPNLLGRNIGGSEIILVDRAFNGTVEVTMDTVLHEIGHAFDELEENSIATAFYAESGWVKNPRSTIGLVQAGGDKAWWYRASQLDWARPYAKESPREDFAESFAAYFLGDAYPSIAFATGAFQPWFDGRGPAPNKIRIIEEFVRTQPGPGWSAPPGWPSCPVGLRCITKITAMPNVILTVEPAGTNLAVMSSQIRGREYADTFNGIHITPSAGSTIANSKSVELSVASVDRVMAELPSAGDRSMNVTNVQKQMRPLTLETRSGLGHSIKSQWTAHDDFFTELELSARL